MRKVYLATYETSELTRARDHSKLWKQKYLELIYKEFNAPLIPRDLGLDSFVTDPDTFSTLLQGEGVGSDVNTQRTTMHKMQALLFWLIYQQHSPCTAQTFFTTISQNEHLASAVLDSKLLVPEAELHAILLSIFARWGTQPIDADAATLHTGLIPFRNPFGASVLRCGIETCSEPFVDEGQLETGKLDARVLHRIRQARARHLIHVFGLKGRFENSQTGLPERCATGTPPTSIHTSLHVSVVRAWAERTPEKRRGIIDNEDDRETFVAEVSRKVCELGRGNVYQSGIEKDVRVVLPSFFEVLGKVVGAEGDVAAYEHDFEKNGLEHKIRFELDVWAKQ